MRLQNKTHSVSSRFVLEFLLVNRTGGLAPQEVINLVISKQNARNTCQTQNGEHPCQHIYILRTWHAFWRPSTLVRFHVLKYPYLFGLAFQRFMLPSALLPVTEVTDLPHNSTCKRCSRPIGTRHFHSSAPPLPRSSHIWFAEIRKHPSRRFREKYQFNWQPMSCHCVCTSYLIMHFARYANSDVDVSHQAATGNDVFFASCTSLAKLAM